MILNTEISAPNEALKPSMQLEVFARDKIIEPQNALPEGYFAHSFYRFGPRTVDPNHPYAPLSENVDPTLDRLPGILRDGLLSAGIANRAGKKLSRNYEDGQNNSHVSIAPTIDMAVLTCQPTSRDAKRLPSTDDTLLTLIVKVDPEKALDDQVVSGAFLYENRISPRNFRGLMVHSMDEQRVEEVVEVMKNASLNNPDNALPVYKYSRLFWPKEEPGNV